MVDAALNAVPGGAAAAGGKSSLLGSVVWSSFSSWLAGAAGAFDPIPTEEITDVAGIDVTDQTDAANPIASTTSVLDANEGAYRVGVPSAPTFFDFNQIMVPSAALYGPNQGTIANFMRTSHLLAQEQMCNYSKCHSQWKKRLLKLK